MTYIPKDEDAKQALDLLTQPSNVVVEKLLGIFPIAKGVGPPYEVPKLEALREVLIGLVCPAPCVGYVNETGWHTLCETKADTMIQILRLDK